MIVSFDEHENIDPDLNYFDDFLSESSVDFSQYCTIGEFQNLILNNRLFYTVMSYNIRSYSSNADSFYSIFLKNCFPEIFIFSETWFSNDFLIEIPNYNCYHSIRDSSRRSGGVSAFIKNSIKSQKIDDLSLSTCTIETCTVEIFLNSSKYVLISVYRPHSDSIENFTRALREILEDSRIRHKNCIVLGDFNINLHSDNSNVKIFCELMNSYNFGNFINKPTRFDTNLECGSLIDHIWCNVPEDNKSGVVLADFTDHLPTYIQIKKKSNYSNCYSEKIKISFRLDGENCRENFRNALSSFNWSSLKCENLNLYLNRFLSKLNELYCKCFPLKIKLVSRRHMNSPWITDSLRKLIRAKSDYFQLFRLGVISKQENNAFKNRVLNKIKLAKRVYYKNKFESNNGNMKNTWSLIRELMLSNRKISSLDRVIYRNAEYTEQSDIARIFNDYFSNVAIELQSRLPPSQIDPLASMNPSNPHTLLLNPITPDECSLIITHLKLTKQSINEIPVRLLKIFHHHLLVPICDLINTCFSLGIFPDSLKSAIVIPIHKKGNKSDIANYRPIALLPVFSKILEKSIFNRLSNFCNQCKIITPNQFGFQNKISTEHAILELMDFLYEVLNDSEYSANIFIDLTKAFDTLDHEILLRKLESYGIRGTSLKLFRSYLAERSQRVKIGNMLSSCLPLGSGVPQGSILGPILFILYINDLPNVSINFSTVLFADDTTISFRDGSLDRLKIACNRDLIRLTEWFNSNKLSVNLNKTLCLLVSNRIFDPTSFCINLASSDVNLVNSCSFLGVKLDNKLKFDLHIDYICRKISRSIGVLYRMRSSVTREIMINLYYSIVHPYLLYCNLVWGGTFDCFIQRLFLLQKRVLRIICNAAFLDHTNPLFIQTKILKIHDLHKFSLACFMFKCDRSEFSRNHTYDTRFRSNLLPDFQRLSLSQHSVRYKAPLIWNELPHELRTLPTIQSFKRNLKEFFISKYNVE